MLIAQGVLDMLESKRITAERGAYLQGDMPFETLVSLARNLVSVEPAVLLPAPSTCRACAIGSCFVAALDRFKDLSLAEFKNTKYGRDSYTQYLQRWFSPYQLDLIEYAFEGRAGEGLTDEDRIAARDFRLQLARSERSKKVLSNPKVREDTTTGARMVLKAIMENIIKNGGIFRPRKVLKRAA